MRKRKISRDILVLAVLTLITVATWTILDLHRIFSDKESISVPQEQLEPLNPELDDEVINQLSEKQYLEKGQYLPPESVPIEIIEEETGEEIAEGEETEETEEGE